MFSEYNSAKVCKVSEKPQLNFLVNAGIYLIEPSALEYIPQGRNCDMPDPIQSLIADQRTVVSFPILEYWLDVGRPSRLRDRARGRSKWENLLMGWKGTRVLVTGAGGFIGSHLAERLVELGAQVRAFVHYNALGTRGWLDQSPARAEIEVVAGDMVDRDSVHKALQGIDVVFHLAALIGIPYSYDAPGSYVRTNIEGTLNVLRSGLELGVKPGCSYIHQ